MKRPNLVFYFSDQQRWDTLGCYGQSLPVSPNLDQLAQEGTLFENAYTCQPVCGPARSCLQSGMYATQTGCYTNGIELPLTVKPLSEYLNEAGYETAYVGKWHLASNELKGLHHETTAIPKEYQGGYRDYWMAADVLEFTSHGYNGYVFDGDGNRHEFVGYRADCINNFAIDYLHNRKTDKPFFLFVSQIEPHHQNDHGVCEGPDGSKRRFADYQVPGDLEGTAGNWRENYPDYLGQCASLDENVGRLVDTLKETGEWDNTIFIYTSDHGSHFCTRNKEYKRACHDGCTHIPLIVHGPGFLGGKRESAMVSLLDLPTTLLDCAGVEKPEQFAGNSLCRLMKEDGEAENWPDSVFMQISESQIGRAVRTKDWKYSVRAQGGGSSAPAASVYYEEFLYDLQKDPHERNNLAAAPEYETVREEMKQRLLYWMEQAGEEKPEIRPNSEMPENMEG